MDKDLAEALAKEIDRWALSYPDAATVMTILSALEIVRHCLTEAYLSAEAKQG